MSRRFGYVAIVMLAGICTARWFVHSPDRRPGISVVELAREAAPASVQQPLDAPAEPATPEEPPAPSPPALDISSLPMPRSLQGTEVDGGVAIDRDGHLIVASSVRQLFDYFLTATGEESQQTIRLRIVAELEKRLPRRAVQEAVALLDRYLQYRERARGLWSDDKSDDLDTRLQQIRALRRDVFGEADAQALFGDEEERDIIAVEQYHAASDPSLSREERDEVLEQFERNLPDEVRLARDEATKPQRLMREEAELRATGGDPLEVRALREQYFGRNGADRLELLDVEEAEWNRRMNDYRSARQAIDGNPSFTEDQRQAAIGQLRAQRCSTQEQVRVDALDRIEKQQGADKRFEQEGIEE
jgi:lipase chaperone LimK